MPRILVVYASIDGQTARIAERIAATLQAMGHEVTVRSHDALEVLWETSTHDAVIVGGAIRYGRHAPGLERMVRDRLADLAGRPSAVVSVCRSAGGPGARPKAARRYLGEFLKRTGWHPPLEESFAGALLYRRYKPFIRFVIRLIMAMAGGDTDTSRDYEYTDWGAVERFAGEFASQVGARPGARVPRHAAALAG